MKVSVIIPVYNVERYLARCLDSVLAAVREVERRGGCGPQTESSVVEIICVNDGSTDGSGEILERYRATFNVQPSTFIVLTKPNGGLGSARNAALDVATGDYILFVDSDDWIPAHAIATFVSVAEASQAALIVSTAFLKDEGREMRDTKGLQPPTWRRRPADWIAGRKIQYCAWNKFYRADLFKTRRYPATIYEDFPVTTDILCEAGEFAAVDEPLYVYCMNAGATSLVRSAFTEKKMNDSIAVVRMTLETAARQRDPRLARFALRQAVNGHASTIGQVWRSRDVGITGVFLREHEALAEAYPELTKHLPLKARIRLYRLRRMKGIDA